MEIQTKVIAGVLVLAPDAVVEIDVGNYREFRDLALQALADHPRVILDASSVGFFDSAGMGVLLSLKKKACGNGGDMFLAGLPPAINEIFQMIGFDSVFSIFPDTAAALREFDEGQN